MVRKISIQLKIMILLTATTVLMISAIVVFNVYSLRSSVEEAYASQLKGITTAINAEYEESRSVKNVQQIFDYIASKNQRVLRLTLHGMKGEVLASTDRGLIGTRVDAGLLPTLEGDETVIARVQDDARQLPTVRLYAPFKEDGATVGVIELLLDSSDEVALIEKRTLLITAVGVSVSIAFLLALGLILRRLFVRPLMVLRKAAAAVQQGEAFSDIELAASQEITEVAAAFNEMVHNLQQRYEELKEAQNRLVQREKMAALGKLVAGIAHEINTPIGVSVTASSYMKQRVDELADQYRSGRMRKSDMEQFLSAAQETVEMMQTNLRRASDLIRSFKQVAVDQSSEAKRNFHIGRYIGEVLFSLSPSLRQTGLDVSVDCERDVEIYNDPGALSQIVTNLVMNSITHAYEPGEQGRLRFHIRASGGRVTITYQDDGKGMPQHTADRIFEPFFTTRRGEGGTGLGMHIVYNIVTQSLGGTIVCRSRPGEGTTFIIDFPMNQGDPHELQ